MDKALPAGEFDFVPEISRDLPIRFLCSIFTVPQEDAPQLISWGDQMIANQDPEYSRAVVDRDDTEAYRLLPFRSPPPTRCSTTPTASGTCDSGIHRTT